MNKITHDDSLFLEGNVLGVAKSSDSGGSTALYHMSFTNDTWVEKEDENELPYYEIRIDKEQHKIENEAEGYVYTLRCQTEKGLITNTWATIGTSISMDSNTKELVLETNEPYNGDLVVTG